MITLKVIKKQGFILYLEDTFGKPQSGRGGGGGGGLGVQIDLLVLNLLRVLL